MFSSTVEAPQQVRPTASDAAAVSLPAGLYALNNWLVLMTLQSVNVAVDALFLLEMLLSGRTSYWQAGMQAEGAAALQLGLAAMSVQVEDLKDNADARLKAPIPTLVLSS